MDLPVERYLSRAFGDGHDLVEKMARSHLVLSGSRALAFFHETSEDRLKELSPCQQTSDWDFYTAGSAHSFGKAIQILQTSGVEFKDIYEELREAMDPGGVGNISASMVEKWGYHSGLIRHEKDLYRHVRRVQRRVQETVCTFPNLATLTISLGKKRGTLFVHRRQTTSTEYKFTAGSNLVVLKGMNKLNEPVQLIAKEGCSPIELIFQFHSSIVQGFICGFAAVHPYYDLAIDGQSFFWEHNTQAPASARKARRKYEGRGYTYIQHSKQSRRDPYLCGINNGAFIPTHVDPSPEHIDMREQYLRFRSLKMLVWEEGEKSTNVYYQEGSSLGNVLRQLAEYRTLDNAEGISCRYLGSHLGDNEVDLVF